MLAPLYKNCACVMRFVGWPCSFRTAPEIRHAYGSVGVRVTRGEKGSGAGRKTAEDLLQPTMSVWRFPSRNIKPGTKLAKRIEVTSLTDHDCRNCLFVTLQMDCRWTIVLRCPATSLVRDGSSMGTWARVTYFSFRSWSIPSA